MGYIFYIGTPHNLEHTQRAGCAAREKVGPPHGREPVIKDGHDPKEEDPGVTQPQRGTTVPQLDEGDPRH